MNVLVTSAGLVGCSTAKQLTERGHQAALYDMAPNESYIRSVVAFAPVVRADVEDMATLIEVLQEYKVQVIAHTAFLIGGSIDQRSFAGEHVRMDPGVLSCNEYVYTKDLAQGMVLACEQPRHHPIYHFGSGNLGSPEDVADAIRQAVPGASIELLPKPVVGPFWRREQVLRRTHGEIGYEPQYDLVKGVADFAGELRRRG